MSATDQEAITGSPLTGSAPPAGKIPARNPVWLAGVVVAGWAVSGLATVLHVDWILLPLLVAAVAAVMRTGRNVLDRVMISVFVVAGGLVAAGLLFSLWPWGLEPFPVAGVMFTVVAVVAWLGRRRPRLPRGLAVSDLIVLGTGLFVFLAEIRPILHLPYLERFRFSATAEDRAAHFALFDTIHRLGSFPFLDQERARVSLQTPTEGDYPAAMHYLYAIVDIFARSTVDPGPAVAAFNRYFVLVLAGYAFFVMSTVWAARWVISPLVRGWRVLAATATVSAVLIGGPLMALVTACFDSQVLGIVFVGMTFAFAIRPPSAMGERVMVLGAGIILVAYTYYLYLPIVVIAVLASLLFDWRAVRRVWRQVAVAAVFVGAVAVLPLYFAATSKLNVGAQALAGGAMFRPSRSATIAATVACLAPLLTAVGRRYRLTRVVGLTIAGSAAITLLFAVYQRIQLGRTSYYFEKLLAVHLIIAIIGAALLAMFLDPLAAPGRGPRRAWVQEVGLGAVATVLAFTAVAGFGPGLKMFGPRTGEWSQSSLGMWMAKHPPLSPAGAAANDTLRTLGYRGLLGDGTSTLFLVSNDGYVNWRVSFFNGTFNRTNGATMGPVNSLLKIDIGGAPVDHESLVKAVGQVEQAVARSDRPLRIMVRDPETAEAIRKAVTARPDSHVTVDVLPAS